MLVVVLVSAAAANAFWACIMMCTILDWTRKMDGRGSLPLLPAPMQAALQVSTATYA